MANKKDEIFDFLTGNGIATEDEVRLVTCINGYSETSLNDILYARLAYHDVEQLWNCERDSYDFSMISFLEDEEEDDEEEEGEEEE